MRTTHFYFRWLLPLVLWVSIFSAQAQRYKLKFDHLTEDNGIYLNSVTSIVQDKYGFMWFGSWCGACRYDGYTFKIFRGREDDTTALSDNMINHIVTDSLNNVWLETGMQSHLFRYNYETETFSRFPRNQVPAYIVAAIKRGRTKEIPAVFNGQFLFKIDSLQLHLRQINSDFRFYYLSSPNDPFSLSDNRIYTICIDNHENLWVGTGSGGVNHANLNIKPFTYYRADKIGKGLIDNGVRAIAKDRQGRLWVGSEDKGLTIIDKNQYSYFAFPQLTNNNIRSVYCDRYGEIWVGTKNGLNRYQPQTHTFQRYFGHLKNGLQDSLIYVMNEDSQGVLWIGTFKGLAYYDRKKDTFIALDYHSTTGGKQIRAIKEDKHHNLWVATEDKGFCKIPRDAQGKLLFEKAVRYAHQMGKENSLIDNRIYTLEIDPMGMIWIGTNLGLSRLNPYTNTFKNFTIKNGLPDDIIMGILSDKKDHIWISHKNGLTRLHIQSFEMQNFNSQDGLQGNDFNQTCCFRDSLSGELFFGGTNGFNSFFPDSIKINTYPPRVVFTQLTVMNQVLEVGTKVNGRVILEKSLLCTPKIVLTWWDKTFSIEFAALHFINPKNNQYKYKLEGIDNQWTYANASMRTASYSHLPAGHYRFVVYAANSDGVWSNTPAILEITILPPWWLTWWAMAFYTLVLVMLVGFVYQYVIAHLKYKEQEEIHKAKLQFFTKISHEFRTPLTLILDPLEKLIHNHLDAATIQNYHSLILRNAKQLLLLVNQLLDFRKLETGHLTLQVEPMDIVVFVRSMASSFATQAQEKNIQFTVESAVEELRMDLDSAKLTMILNNLLSNAFKFTPPQGQVKVSIELEKEKVVLKVQDSGIGIATNEQEKIFDIFYQSTHLIHHQGSGIGLALTKELVELHKGRISVESQPNQGTCFTVCLPMVETKYRKTPSSIQEIVSPENQVETNTINLDSSDLPLLLVVDDTVDICNYIVSIFKDNYRIVVANNGLEGFERASETLPDIVISDIMMPHMNGFELCHRLKTDERTSHIPVILLSARQSEESQTQGYETGADAYVTKPFNSLVLTAQVHNLLTQRQRLRELFSQGSSLELKKIAINSTDEVFLKKVSTLVEENLEDEEFNIDALAEKLKMSRSQFYRKIKALTNKSLHDFITTLRMNKALEYLLSGEYNITEIAYKVGFSLPNNFTRAFAKHFGTSPSKYLDSLKNNLVA